MQTLTKREKTLLYILFCTIIVIGGVFLLIMPAMNRKTTLTSEYEALKLTLSSEQNNKLDTSNLEEDYKKAVDELSKIKAKYYTQMKVEDIDKLITNLAITHYLTPIALSVSEIKDEEIMSYAEYLKTLEAENEEKTETKKNENEKSANTLPVYDVTLNVEGTVQNLQKLVNATNTMKTIKIASVNYSSQQSAKKTMTITFKIFMLKT